MVSIPYHSFELSIWIMGFYCQWEYCLVLCRNRVVYRLSHIICIVCLDYSSLVLSCVPILTIVNMYLLIQVVDMYFRLVLLSLLYYQVVVLYYLTRLWFWYIGLMICLYCVLCFLTSILDRVLDVSRNYHYVKY